MHSSKVLSWTPATYQQYNNLRDDARGSSYLLPHESTTPNMTVVVESGYFSNTAWNRVDYVWGTATIGAVWAYPRYDLLSVDTSGTLVTTVGTASASPIKPTLPAGNLSVCYVYVRVWGTSVKTDDDTINHYIIDTRTILTAPAAALSSTDSLTEWTTNLYYTSARANSDFDTRLATKSTTNLSEGTNLYFTTARVLATTLAGLSTTTNAVITSADSSLSAFGKIQKQITDLTTTVGTKAPTAGPTFTGNIQFCEQIVEPYYWPRYTLLSDTSTSYKWRSAALATLMEINPAWVQISKPLTLVGSGKMLTIGDDSSIYDVNQANTMMLAGEQDATQWKLLLGTGGSYIKGNTDGTMDINWYTPLAAKWQGYTSGLTANAAISARDIVVKVNSTQCGKGDATAIANMEIIGIATEACSSWATPKIQTKGIIWGFSGLTVWEPYYLSNTAWAISLSEGTYYAKIGYAVSVTEIMLEIEFTVFQAGVTAAGNWSATYSSTFTWKRDFVMYSWGGLDYNGTGGFGGQFDWTSPCTNISSTKIKWYGRPSTVVRAQATNGNNGGCNNTIRVCYYL